MPEPYFCPVEGCDFGHGQEKDLTAARSHISASTDDAHDWDALKPDVEAQAKEDEEGNEDPPDDESDETPADDPGESENSDDADPSDGDDEQQEGDEMVTKDEYEQQSNDSDDSDDDDPDGGSQDTTGIGIGSLSDIPTGLLLVAALIIVVLAWLLLAEDDSETVETGGAETVDVEETDAPANSESSSNPEPTGDADGGLVG